MQDRGTKLRKRNFVLRIRARFFLFFFFFFYFIFIFFLFLRATTINLARVATPWKQMKRRIRSGRTLAILLTVLQDQIRTSASDKRGRKLGWVGSRRVRAPFAAAL